VEAVMLATYLDSTNLKPDAGANEIRSLCEEAIRYQMAAVCIHPYRLKLAAAIMKNSGVNLCTVIGFPLGANTTAGKVFEAREALATGADELDMVINIAALKDGDSHLISEIKALLALKDQYDFILKVIVETALLTVEELKYLTQLLTNLKADYIKTSTGYAARGVSLQDIQIISTHKGPDLKIKASGGIKTADFACKLIAAGANRLGTSNAAQLLAGSD